MNDKTSYLDKIIDTVVECCVTEFRGARNFTREDLLSNNKCQNVVMTRCILAMILLGDGYSVETIAFVLDKTPHAVRNLFRVGHNYQMTSKAFQIASAQATIKCDEIRV